MADNEPLNLERERRIRRKIRGLGEAIESAGEHDQFERKPTDYLEDKATMTDEQRAFTVADVAELLDVTTDTVRRWCRNDELEAAKFGSAGYRISRGALTDFYRKRGGGELFDVDPGALDALEEQARDAGREAVSVAADSEDLDPDNFPLPGDWRWLRSELGRKPTAAERETFRAWYLDGLEDARSEG